MWLLIATIQLLHMRNLRSVKYGGYFPLLNKHCRPQIFLTNGLRNQYAAMHLLYNQRCQKPEEPDG